MARLDLQQKLAILSDAAKYDASCASSGGVKRDSRDGKELGSNEGSLPGTTLQIQKCPSRGTFVFGGPCRIRTYDQVIKSHLLYQLS